MDSSPRPVYIYVLIDPRSAEIRYVGKTESPQQRLREHLHFAHNGHDRSYKAMWIKQLLDLGLCPIFRIVKDTSQAEWADDERVIIRSLRANGAPLTNIARGGEGGDPTPMWEPFRRQHEHACRRGHPWTPETTMLIQHPDGSTHRTCRVCKRIRSNEYYRRRHPERHLPETCPKGHPRTPENTAIYSDPSRPCGVAIRCRECLRDRSRTYKRRSVDEKGTCRHHVHLRTAENGFYTATRDGRRSWHCTACRK